MRKILFVAMGLGIGGTEKTLVEALNALDKSNNDVTVYLRKDRTDLIDLIDPQVHVIVNQIINKADNKVLVRIGKCLAKWCEILKLYRVERYLQRKIRKYILLKRFEYERVTYFQNQNYDYAVAYDMAEECAKFVVNGVKADKKVAFFHSSKLYDSKAKLYEKFDTIVGVNRIVAQGIKSDYPKLKNKVVDIENYLSPDWVYRELDKLENVNCPKHELILCTCGMMAEWKGFDLAVNAAKLIDDEGIDFHWFFVGDGPERKHIENMLKCNNISSRVTITGFENNPFGYMKLCDIYVQPSKEEAHATTMVESKILNKPIVSTNTVAGKYFNEMYKCCIITEKTAESLAAGILELYYNKSKIQELTVNEKLIDYTEMKEEYILKINQLFM